MSVGVVDLDHRSHAASREGLRWQVRRRLSTVPDFHWRQRRRKWRDWRVWPRLPDRWQGRRRPGETLGGRWAVHQHGSALLCSLGRKRCGRRRMPCRHRRCWRDIRARPCARCRGERRDTLGSRRAVHQDGSALLSSPGRKRCGRRRRPRRCWRNIRARPCARRRGERRDTLGSRRAVHQDGSALLSSPGRKRCGRRRRPRRCWRDIRARPCARRRGKRRDCRR